MTSIGPTFSDELATGVVAAGLDPGDLPITWGADGVSGLDQCTPPQRALIEAVLAAHDPGKPPRRLVPKSLIIARLQEAGKLVAAKSALDADLYTRERWYAPDQPAVHSDDAEAVALLQAIGVDPDVILAP
jgi:hypothetical protein